MKKTRYFFLTLIMSVLAFTGCASTGESDSISKGETSNVSSENKNSDNSGQTIDPDSRYQLVNNEILFDEEGDWVQKYNYCPSILVDGDNGYCWYCTSITDGIGGDDHIGYRRGVIKDGKWVWGSKKIAISPKENSWYSGNICDPDVIKGEFAYKGETYTYLMTVLGCTTKDNTSNMFGFFVAKSPDGPWIEAETVSPLYDFYDEYPDYVYKPGVNSFIWGWGQSCVLSCDGKGKVLIFYTGRISTGAKVECWDFSNLDTPSMIYEKEIRNTGVVDLNGQRDTICNSHFVFDKTKSRFYMLCDVHPFDEYQWPTNLPLKTNVYYVDVPTTIDFYNIFKAKYEWTLLFSLDKEKTGSPRNHNCCFYRDSYGYMLNTHDLDIAYTYAPLGDDWKVLFWYRIRGFRYKVD